ncbi:MAG TPA: MMPL family transporter, partial [Polyangiaceae bacterium]|nr:MMPL family transporter [Polyangiaceae bacterium]
MKQIDARKLVQWVLRHARWLSVIVLLVTIVAGYRTVRTYGALRSDLEELLPVQAPSVAALTALRDRLPGVRHLGVVVHVEKPQAQAAAFAFLDRLAERVRTYPKDMVASVRVNSQEERTFAETYALQLMEPADVRSLRESVERLRDWQVSRGMGLDLEDGTDEAKPVVPFAELRAKYEARYGVPAKTPDGRFLSADGKNVVLLIRTAGHTTSQRDDSRLLDRVRADVRALGFPNAFDASLELGYAGDVASRVEEAHGLESDLTLSGIVVMLLELLVVAFFYRSLRSLPILFVPLVTGTFAAFAIAALPPLSIRYLNSNTAFLGSIVIGNGINSGVILLARYEEERRLGHSVAEAIEIAVAGTWRATLAAALAAACAYGSLVFTEFRGFNQFGWIGGIGLITCWLSAYSVLPLMLKWLGAGVGVSPRRQAQAQPSSGSPGWLGRLTLGHPRAVLLVAGALAVASVAGLVHRSSDIVEYDLSKLRRRDSWENGERFWGKRMDSAFNRYLTPTVLLADSRQEARELEARLRDLMQRRAAGDLIGSVRSADMLLPETRAESAREASKLKAILTPRLLKEISSSDQELVQRALSERSLVPLEAHDVPDSLAMGFRERSGRMDRNVIVFPKLTTGTWDAARLDGYANDLRRAATFDGHARPVAGSLLLSSDIARAMKADGPKATLLSLLSVIAICWIAFRDEKRSRGAS